MGSTLQDSGSLTAAQKAQFVQSQIPPDGLFAGQQWRVSPEPFALGPKVVEELETLGRVLLRFYRAVNLLYRQSLAGKEPAWVAHWLDKGKPDSLLERQRSHAFKSEIPRVIRPDLLLLDEHLAITELDSVPGGIGLTAWLGQVYGQLATQSEPLEGRSQPLPASVNNPNSPTASNSLNPHQVLGGPDGMLRGFEGIFGDAPQVHIVVSAESATYKPEMEWMAQQLGPARFHVRDGHFKEFAPGDAVYRFFELFDVANVENANRIFDLASRKELRLTPPPKPLFEEKMLFALLWNRNLRGFWRRELGEHFFERMLRLTPYTWMMDPAPLPPHGAVPELNLTDWQQLKTLSQRERELILKVSGFAETAWGSRGVYLGSDLSAADWSAAVDLALRSFEHSPFVLQRYYRPQAVDAEWFDFERQQRVPFKGRVRLCPFYFVVGEGDSARAQLGGVLATICPADKKIIHGMTEAVLAPCSHGLA